MPVTTKHLFTVSMDVARARKTLFNQICDSAHVPGVRAVTRRKTEPAAFNLAGELRMLDGKSPLNYVAIYETESPDVLLGGSGGGAPLAKPGAPFTSNRRHIVRKEM